MNSGPWETRTGWRLFAKGIALALGANVWLTLVVLPAIYTGAIRTPLIAALCAMPPAVLLIGVLRRSEWLMLLGFPLALLLPSIAAPEIIAGSAFGPLRMVVIAAGLLAYLFGVSFFSAYREPRAPVSVRELSSANTPVPDRWRRRLRVYRWLIALSVVFPATLLWAVLFDSTNQAYVLRLFPGRSASMAALMTIGVLGLWSAIYAYAFIGPLASHRTGDRPLAIELAELRTTVARGRPRPTFYLGVATALIGMAALIFTRYL